MNAIKLIDEKVYPRPICYMANCIHPTNLKLALSNNQDKSLLNRFSGIQANASILSPEELEQCAVVKQDAFDNIINEMTLLQSQYDFKIIGGCCGTNDKFIDFLSERAIKTARNSR